MLAFGHAPAWLHVGQCGCDSEARCELPRVDGLRSHHSSQTPTFAIRVADAAENHACEHACCLHGQSDHGQSDPGQYEDRKLARSSSQPPNKVCSDNESSAVRCGGCHSDGTESVPHDSESCVVCQSLAAPTGYVASVLDLSTSHPAEFDAAVPTDSIGAIFFNVLPPSRGPPSVAV